jgi:ferredoxin-NADP reductase
MKLLTRTIQLLEKKELTPNIYELHFSKPVDFAFDAGQFVQCMIPNEGKITSRSYSLASPPEDKTILFCVKILKDGVGSSFFRKMTIGDRMEIRGPLGRFVCSEDAVGHIFVATGVGIAPIMGMIKDQLVYKKTDKEIRLLFGLRFEDDFFWLDKLDALSKQFDQFSYQCTISRPTNTWTGFSGRVTDHLDYYNILCDFYICGSPNMVKDVRAILNKRGVRPKQIHFEIF